MAGSHSDNAFDKVRLLAALAVLLSHSFPLARLDEPMLFGDSLGKFAVLVFFALSGYLVCQSWDRDPHLKRFAQRRALRIVPGLVVAVLVTTFVIGTLASEASAGAFVSDVRTWRYVADNLLLINSVETLPQTFLAQPTQVFNGSLWTLRYEVAMYALLAVGAVLLGARHACVAGFLLAAGVLAGLSGEGVKAQPVPIPFVWKFGLEFDAVRLAKLGAVFFGAACLYLYRQRVPLHWPAAVAMLVACAWVPSAPLQNVLLVMLVPYATVAVAMAPPRQLAGAWDNDLSYGIYVYAYPVQQFVSEIAQSRQWGWAAAFMGSLLLTLMLAALSWRWIERPALRFKPARAAYPVARPAQA